MAKDFEEWHNVKTQLDKINDSQIPLFKQREVWWCSIGLNVGVEVYGKNQIFTRPVLILRKYNRQTFFGLPLTSRRKEGYFRFPIEFGGIKGDVLLDQARVFDARRLSDLMGKIILKQ